MKRDWAKDALMMSMSMISAEDGLMASSKSCHGLKPCTFSKFSSYAISSFSSFWVTDLILEVLSGSTQYLRAEAAKTSSETCR